MYTAEKVFKGENVHGNDSLLVVSANGGSVELAYGMADGSFVVVDTITESAAAVFDNRMDVKITPSGGAVYDVR